jgi:hypothetical protein
MTTGWEQQQMKVALFGPKSTILVIVKQTLLRNYQWPFHAR